jgi:protocatechuate 3,4-dioxygenase beta subunit
MKFDTKILIAAAAWLCAASAIAQTAAPAPATLDIKVRHSITGADLGTSAAIDIAGQDGHVTRHTGYKEAALARRFDMQAGHKSLRFSAPGHRDAQVNFNLQPGERLPVKVLLDPEVLPEEMKPEVIQSKIQPGKAMLHGHVVDEDSGKPLKGAVVLLEQAKVQTVTDEKGYFILNSVVPPTFRQANEIPSTDTLVIRARGYKDQRIVDTLLVEDATHFAIELEAGTGVNQRNDTHKLVQAARAAQLQNAR